MSVSLDEERGCSQRLLDDKAELMELLESSQADVHELRAVLDRANARESDLQEKLEQARESESFYRTEAN